MAAKPENMTVKVTYDMQAVKDALRAERMWYLEAFEKIERAFEDDVGSDERKVVAMATCRDRIRKLIEELDPPKATPERFDEYGHYGENNGPV